MIRTVLFVALVVVIASAFSQEPLVVESYRDVRAGFEILLPPGYDFGTLGTTVYFATPERVAFLESIGFGTDFFGPYLRLRSAFEDFQDCQAPAGPGSGDTRYVHDQGMVAGQPAFACTVAPIETMGDLIHERRVRVRMPGGGALEFEMTSCAYETCDDSRAWFEAMIESLRWLE